MTIKDTAASRLGQQIGWDKDNRRARKRSQSSEDGMAREWESSRLGASPPEVLGKLRADVKNDIFGAYGIPSSIHGTGGSARESYRQFLASTILPLAKMVLEELALKLDIPTLALDFSELRAADIATRARAFKQLVDAGMDKDEAMAKAGLD